MILLAGLICLILWLVLGSFILLIAAIVLLILGAFLFFVPVGGRTHRWY